MGNKIHENEKGYTEIIFEGKQDSESIYKLIEDSLDYNNKLSLQGKQIKTMLDLTKAGDLDAGAAKQAIGGFSNIDYDKIAIFGASDELTEKLKQILNLTGKELPVKMFSMKEEAEEWLLADS